MSPNFDPIMLNPDDTLLIGRWRHERSRSVADATCQRIELLVGRHLVKLAISEYGASTRYQDPCDSRCWSAPIRTAIGTWGGSVSDLYFGRSGACEVWQGALPVFRLKWSHIMKLPEDMLLTANRESSEEAWRSCDFPDVLKRASAHRLACIGGQFQFRGPIGTAEMYWLKADSTPRRRGEDWNSYVARANSEVLCLFTRLVEQTDFHAEALEWKHIVQALESGLIADPTEHLYFVAYFNRDPEMAE